jgi:hypothetical protein
MKAIKKILLSLLTVCIVFTSCKKSATQVTTTFVVKYEVIWTSALLTQQGLSSTITYTNATGNPQIISNFSGTSWTNTITYQNPAAVTLSASLYGSGTGTCTVNIYVNGVLKSTSSSNGIALGGADYGFVAEASYFL